MIVVSDSSPLITLSKIGHLHILPRLYETVHITSTVFAEVAVSGAGLWGAAEVSNAEWVRIATLERHPGLPLEFTAGLGAGEISTVRLAKELNADVALIDDRKARALAVKFGVTPLGCVGILQSGFQAGLIPELRTAYQLLLDSGAFVDRRILAANLRALNLPGLDT
ncbi:MAG: hypothetical protein ABI972_03095 [Acidobacteriota bacterium]